ncbi:hypothetical protein FDUTEX481_06712 [Tolypothrix sp. PCC 7601]|nr:hypothetical protein FDUTEX481_06712 [Tolypothrix sp. PCC 7601]
MILLSTQNSITSKNVSRVQRTGDRKIGVRIGCWLECVDIAAVLSVILLNQKLIFKK